MNMLFIVAGVIFCYVTIWFIVSRIIQRNDVGDIAWGPGIALVGVTAFLASTEPTVRTVLLTALVVFWGMRLGSHIFARNRKKTEDSRYLALAQSWGRWTHVISYLQVFLLQGVLMIFVGYPLVHANVFAERGLDIFMLIGALVWLCGLTIEAIADRQLRGFFAQPPLTRGSIMQRGLWRYSRHPNYFGEVLLWWGIFIIVAPLTLSYIALIGPITITCLILFVSGVPLAERMMAGKPGWEEYTRITSVFIPLPPRN